MRKLTALLGLLAAVLLAGCAKEYVYKPIPVRDIAAYPNVSTALGARIGAEAFYDAGRAKELFGFNLRKAGVVPVQVAVSNAGKSAIGLASGAMVMDSDNNWWEMLPQSVVNDRVAAHLGGVDGQAAGKRSLLYGLAGAIVGAAVGVASDSNVGSAAGKGAAVGAAIGAASEILTGQGGEGPAQAGRDFGARNLGNQLVPAGANTYGFLYFPAEMKEPRRLRLFLRPGKETGGKDSFGYDLTPTVEWTGEPVTLEMNL